MIELYPEVKLVHVSSVAASGLLFFVRGLAVLSGARWPMAAPLRYLSITIDTVLLAAALTLSWTLSLYPFQQDWLTAKVLLLVVYIVLGSFALKRARTMGGKFFCWLAALAVFGAIVSIARSHHPLGALWPLAG
ncbi:MAG TPA: SirB2 family protein [Gammaproteobacteria bacterium]